MKEILFQFGISGENFQVIPFGSGLIHTTWKIVDQQGAPKYILQKVNQQIFRQPGNIAFNTRIINNYLEVHFPDYLFVSSLVSISGEEFVNYQQECYRLFPFITNSQTIDVVEKPEQAYEASRQFGKFTKLLSGFDASQLKITLTDFHNLTLRYQQFEKAVENGNTERIAQSKELIAMIMENKRIVREYEACKKILTIRVTHHDTKISNALFDITGKGLCVIDLDTVMPGYFLSDVGDMMRTYLSPANEEEKDFSKIFIRAAFFDAIEAGYLSEMGAELSETEKQHFHFAGEFMIYMQALRFLTDHLNNDIYYGAKYTGHNFVRAGNQIILLQRLQEFKSELSACLPR